MITAIVILNVVFITLAVGAMVSHLGWAIVKDKQDAPGAGAFGEGA